VDPAQTLAASAAHGFQVLQCEECASSVRDALVAAGYPGEIIELRAAGTRPYIICLSYDGGQATITRNGRHVGTRVGDLVFDNLHPDGMVFDQWVKDLDAWGGVIVAVITPF